MDNLKKNIFITGASGFIGRRICQYLTKKNYAIYAIGRSAEKFNATTCQFEIIIGDINDDDFLLELSEYKIDIFIHCVGEIKNTEEMVLANEQLPIKILSTLHKNVKHWIHLSSVGVYGPPTDKCVTENSPKNPIGTYEVTKYNGENNVIDYCSSNSVNYTILRPSNVVGSDMPNQSFFKLLNAIKTNKYFFIGDSSNYVFNYVHVDDVCHAVHLCVDSELAINEIFNVSDHLPQQLFIDTVGSITGKNITTRTVNKTAIRLASYIFKWLPLFPITTATIQAVTTESTYDMYNIQNKLSFKHIVGLRAALSKML